MTGVVFGRAHVVVLAGFRQVLVLLCLRTSRRGLMTLYVVHCLMMAQCSSAFVWRLLG